MGAINIRDTAQWASLLRAEPARPVLVHLNGDTTWLLQLPYPPGAAASETPSSRTHFNLLIDPWLQGPQSDVASWFSTQYHVTAPAVKSLAELQAALRGLAQTADAGAATQKGNRQPSCIDAVAISHEFTDHCHKATLRELPKNTPVYAADVAADLIRSWKYFDNEAVITAPGLAKDAAWMSLSHAKLPSWLRIGRLITPGNSLYYHSAIIIAYSSHDTSRAADAPGEAVVYSPHGISAHDVADLPSCGLSTLAMMHGLHDVRLFMVKQLNLGALNAIEAVRASGAKYWIGTHDEEKTGKGLIAPFLQRTRYSLRQAVAHAEKKRRKTNDTDDEKGYEFKELAPGDALLLE